MSGSSSTLSTSRRLLAGILGALVAKVAFEAFLTYGFDRPLFHCSAFVDNMHCSFADWLVNPGDLIVMIPGFVIGVGVSDFFGWSKSGKPS